MVKEQMKSRSPNWLTGGGEMGERIRSFDWSTTQIGAIETFPQSLRSALSIMLSSKAHIIIFWGTDLITFYNDAYAALLGTKHPSLLGQPARDCWQDIWEVLGALLNQVIETGEGFYAEDYLFVPNRYGYTEEAYFDISYDPIRDESGEVGGIFCSVKETTRRVVDARRLQTLRQLGTQTATAKTVEIACQSAIASLACNSADLPFVLLYLLDSTGKAQLIEATGVQSTFKPRFATMDLAAEATPLLLSITEAAQQGKPIVIRNLSEQFGDDLPTCSVGEITERPERAIVLPLVRSDTQPPIGFLVAGVSPFQAFNSEYEDFLALVAASVTTGITNARAYEEERQRAEDLANLDRAKTSFFSNISHELRTPLTLMIAPLEQTLNEHDGNLPATARSQLELAQRNGKRLLKLVNTLLDFSRIEAGRTQVNYEPTNLAAYTTELASLFEGTIRQAGLKLSVDCPPLPNLIEVDQAMWEKIVLNLLSNAFKFTFEGEIAIALRTSNSQVELTVSDTGTGIPSVELPRLFDRFHRIEGARGRSFEGTGIGLSLVQELVQLQGGTISVESTVGQGSTFRVRLPMRITSDTLTQSNHSKALRDRAEAYVQEAHLWSSETTKAPETAERSQPENPVSISARILIVDDNPEMRQYLSRILDQFYEVETAEDGETALAAALSRTPDLVLTDVMMPGINGFELLKQLRLHPQTRDLPILLLSASAGEASAVAGLELGADDYLVKPFSTRELIARVATNLELGRSRRSAVRRRIDAVLSSVTDFIYTFDLAGRFTYVNQPLLDLWQKTYTEVIGKNLFELGYPPDLADRLQQQIQQVITTRQPLKDEAPFTSDLGTRDYEYIFVPLFDATGAVEAVAGTTRDITDRKQAETLLEATNARLKLLSEATNELLVNENPQVFLHHLFEKLSAHLDLEIYVNYLLQEDEQRLRLTAHSGISAEIATATEFLELGQAVCGYVVQQEKAVVLENALQSTSPLAIPVQSVGIRAYASYPLIVNHRAIGTLGFGTRNRDRFTPDELELMQTVCNQVATALQRSQLIKALQQRAEELDRVNRIKDEFLAVLSHELRTPLNPILGWTRLLQSGNLKPEKVTEAINIIERNAKLQVQLIEDLLDISRILRGKLVLNMLPVNLAFTLNSAIDTVKLAIEAKAITLQTQFDPNIGQVMGDGGRLQQVVWNLLSNAVKFTPAGGQITVTLMPQGTSAQIQVSDTGKGVNPDFLPYMFEHFQQEDGAITRKFGGLGLGLAIARQIVELHGGTIQAESAGEGQGATFTVLLPLSSLDAGGTVVAPNSTLITSSLALSNVRVLVVDDELDTRELTTFVLEQAGAIVTTVSSALEALNKFTASEIDIVVSDVGMPEMDGYALIRQIRQFPQGDRIPAIALTAYAGEVDQQQAYSAGFQQHLSKPVEPEQLINAIYTLCNASVSQN